MRRAEIPENEVLTEVYFKHVRFSSQSALLCGYLKGLMMPGRQIPDGCIGPISGDLNNAAMIFVRRWLLDMYKTALLR